MQELIIKIGGMTCQGCVRNVTGVLSGLAGVEKAEVSLGESRAVVRYDPAQVSPAALRQAVEEAGFDAA